MSVLVSEERIRLKRASILEMLRFLQTAHIQMRRSRVTTCLVGTGLGVCFIVLALSRGGPQPPSVGQLSFDRLPADRETTHSSKTTTSSVPSEAGLSFPSTLANESRHESSNDNISTHTAITDRPATRDNNEKLKIWYPNWWLEAWSNTATYGKSDVFVDDKPLIHSPCVSGQTTGETFKFLEPRQYLPNSKNPCWWVDPRRKTGLRCVPYFYLAGVAKCGTTDIFGRVTKHPDLLKGSQKEYHWWERLRYDDPPYRWTFKEYVDKIIGNSIGEMEKDLRTKGSTVKIFGDFSPSYFFHPQFWPKLQGNQGCQEPRYIITQHIRHLYRDAKIILTFRHPTPRLYSRFLSRVPRTTFLQGDGPREFHHYVLRAIKAYSKCFAQWSIRHCVYNGSLYGDVKTRLMEGMYPTFMADWLRVWPRDQLHIMRYEDYGGHEEERIAEIFEFLGLAPLNQTEMARISAKQVSNSGAKEYHSIGPMLPETKEILDKFYQPFINQFAEILNDKRFLWLDTKH